MNYSRNGSKYVYFDWLCNKIVSDDSYDELLNCLHNMRFRAVYPYDESRESAIDDLRGDFLYEHRGIYANELPYDYSVLELLVELAERIEDKVMDNPLYGDRSKKWFWIMIENLGLDDMYNENFDEDYVVEAVSRWLRHDFEPNGDGSPFPLKHPPTDARDVDIWRLANWYLSERFEGRW